MVQNNKPITRKGFFLLFLLLFTYFHPYARHHSLVIKRKNASIVDTTRSFKVDSYVIHAKSDFEYISLVKSSNDTLILKACSEYLCSPFGKINKRSELKKSTLKNWHVISTIVEKTESLGNSSTLKLRHNQSSLNLMFCDYTEPTRYSYINKGAILGNDISFMKRMKPEMSLNTFWDIFFENFPSQLQRRYKIVIFEACIDNIPRHIYKFKDGKLILVKFE